MKKIIIFLLTFILIISGFQINGQIFELKFTAVNNTTWIPADSIKIINKTQDCDTMLYYPDTVLSLSYVGVKEVSGGGSSFTFLDLYPNPVLNDAVLELAIHKGEEIEILVSSSSGQIIGRWKSTIEKGVHHFRLIPGNEGLYIITLQSKLSRQTLKLVNANTKRSNRFKLSYMGKEGSGIALKSNKQKSTFTYEFGDTLLMINFVQNLESASLLTPESSQLLSFQFAMNIPCQGIPTVTYEGQVYNTVQIFNQCWLKENLNVGIMIPAGQQMSNDGIIEKYCYNNSEDSCAIYGGLYQWGEVFEK